MKTACLSFLLLLTVAITANAQTASTVITLDGTSTERYSKPSQDDPEASALSELMSDIEAEFGSLDDPKNVAIIEKKLENLENSDILSRIARINRKYYASLIEMGFTTDEAMKIIIANPIVDLIRKTKNEDIPKKSRTLSLEMQ